MNFHHHISYAARVASVEAARVAAHTTHRAATERAKKLLTDADADRDAALKAVEKAAADAYEARRAQLEKDLYSQLEPVCDAYRRDSRGATAEALRTTWNALATRAREELGGELRIDCLVYALFPTCQLGHATEHVGALRRSVSGSQTFADALRQLMVHSERGGSYISNTPPSADERAALTSNEVRGLEQKRERTRRDTERARVASLGAPKLPSIKNVTRLLTF